MEIFKDIDAKFLKADELMRYGEVNQAKDLLDEILYEIPDYGRAHNHLGWLFGHRMSDFGRAEYHLRMAMKFAPDFQGGYRNYAYLLLDMNRAEDLLKHAEKSLKRKGMDMGFMHRMHGVALELTGKYSEAITSMQEAKRYAMDVEALYSLKDDIRRVRKKMGLLKRLRYLGA